jgi:valyl-tRNA synthetase
LSAKKEAKRLEKEAKLAAKAGKVTANTTAGDRKAKAEKEKKQAEDAFVNTTPPGEKKGEHQTVPPLEHWMNSSLPRSFPANGQRL